MVSKFYFSAAIFELYVGSSYKSELFLFAAAVAAALDLKEAQILFYFIYLFITLVRNKWLSLSQRWYQSLAEGRAVIFMI